MSYFADYLSSEGIERPLDVLFVSPMQFRCKPQVGTAALLTWTELGELLSRPSIAEAKDSAGGFSPARYRDDIRRKADLVWIGVLVIDVDGNGDVDRIADAVKAYDAIVLETFSSTNDDPRSRLLLRLAEPVDAATYEELHAIVRAHLKTIDAVTDDGAKDASRLSYMPVRRPGAGYRFRINHGRALDAERVIAAQPPKPQPKPATVVAPEHRDAYVRGALVRASQAVAAASNGARHETLNREAFALARLDLSEDEIAGALVPAFVAAAGEARRWEARRTIRDAVKARKGAA